MRIFNMNKRIVLTVFLTLFFSMFSLVLGAVEGSTSVMFGNNNGSCQSNPDSSYWIDFFGVKTWTVDSLGLFSNDCFLRDSASGLYLKNVSCCPLEWDSCVSSETYPGGRCIKDVGFCSNLLEDECEGNSALAAKEVGEEYTGEIYFLNGEECSDTISPKCTWVDNSCSASTVNTTICDNAVVSSLTCALVEGSREDLCNSVDKKIIINYLAWAKNNSLTEPIWVDPSSLGMASCVNSTKDYECSASIQLPFFGLTNFIFSVSI